MLTKICLSLLIFCVLSSKFVSGQEDSLRSALNEIDRRQRDLLDYDEAEYGYPLDRPEDLAFLKTAANYNPERSYGKFAQPLVGYFENDDYDSNLLNKRISSAFRERVEEDNRKQLDELAQNSISNVETEGNYGVDNDEDYEELLKEFWSKYRRPYEVGKLYPAMDKRYYYPQLGMDSIALRKRNRYYDTSAHEYAPTDNFDDDDDDYEINYLRKRYYQKENQLNRIRQMYTNPYSQLKRFPVTKRSSDYISKEENPKPKKVSAPKKQTDPKIEKDLRNIFGSKPDTVAPTTKSETTTLTPPPKTTNQRKVNQGKETKEVNKEVFSPVAAVSERPLQIKKKSIDWSDYFGLDRRKKSDTDDLDKEWLIERYHKSVAVGAKKRNAEAPLSSFRNHDEPIKKGYLEDADADKDKLVPDEQRIYDMDTKLKVMEDRIVDDALKYTGAHEGETDPKEIQEVKDKVISRLAAAYSLEKMRNALGEYKLEVSKDKGNFKSGGKDDDYTFAEEKRIAIPRKQVVDKENVPDADNNIKCTDGKENCHEQNYKTPSEIFENYFGVGECPAIQRACNEIAIAAGQYGPVFKAACGMHEMCLLCSNNSWFSPTRQCNSLFLAKAFDLCKGNQECQRVAQRSIRYLLDVSRSLHSQPSAIDDCELSCPESESMLNPSDAR